MPPHSAPPNISQARLDTIITSLTAAVTIVERLSNGVHTPFLQPISNTIRSLLSSVQTVKRNKNDCAQMMEKIHDLTYGIISLHINPETKTDLSPHILNQIVEFAKTLHKIHVFVEAQQDKSRIKQFFRQGEMNTLLKDCNTGLQQLLDIFKFQAGSLLNDAVEMRNFGEKTHQEVLELIGCLADETASDNTSSMTQLFSGSQTRYEILTHSSK
ncbi:hypothetical protein MVEN_00267800 [Mycena venus]|uniref:Mixed lineage kinase domain-containing protein n=1 Tax=Mycena venus TaxID=2733690 RepID=A0A8H6Z1V9_9AGAR|nr:hypothetical protein MVEN_00267800 [Mycena venus]